MITNEEVYRIGALNKPHGVCGELSFTFTDDIFDRTDGKYLVCLLDGIFVPFFIEKYGFRSHNVAIVKLEGIDSMERARTFMNVAVYYPIKYVEAEAVLNDELGKVSHSGSSKVSPPFSVYAFTGFEMKDAISGILGKISDVDISTANTLFVVENEKGELLIPACEEFIVKVDYENKQLLMNLPEGLTDLMLN
ncbi:Ribosome maturation factor RimM [termite gut metagenome]|uniref:Ribosome maturation factor RimM n=1 Tax=termite gut metagenome TaxID=433724 RepID=A0A5J4SVV0_9ZZZZ